jgi:hypothetical protein
VSDTVTRSPHARIAEPLAAEGGEAKEVVNPVIPDELGDRLGCHRLLPAAGSSCMLRVLAPDSPSDASSARTRCATTPRPPSGPSVEAEQVRRDYDATLAEARAEASRIVDAARQAGEAAPGRDHPRGEDEVAARAAGGACRSRRRPHHGARRTPLAGRCRPARGVAAASKVVQRPTSTSRPTRRGRRARALGEREPLREETHMNALLLAEEGNHFWLPHDINEVIWGTIAFLIVAFLLYKKFVAASDLGGDGRSAGAHRRRARPRRRPIGSDAADRSGTASRRRSPTPTARPLGSSPRPARAPSPARPSDIGPVPRPRHRGASRTCRRRARGRPSPGRERSCR